MRVWGFPICAVVVILSAVFAGATLVFVLAPVLVWTAVLYVRCNLETIRSRRDDSER